MTGAEHYREAELFAHRSEDEYLGSVEQSVCLQRAQIHATLAVAAATIEAAHGEGWSEVLKPADAGAVSE